MLTKQCPHCGKDFPLAKQSELKTRKFCSIACRAASKEIERVSFSCKTCDKTFVRSPGELKQYRKTFGKDPMYCSIPCSSVGRKADSEVGRIYTCVQCGGAIHPKRNESGHLTRNFKLCSTECRSKFRSEGAASRVLTTITREQKKNGYVWLSIPIHLSGTGRRERVQEHRQVMEGAIGRKLIDGEEIHHLNGQRGDNRLANLQIWSTRQPKGQRDIDKITFAIETCQLYPGALAAAGFELKAIPPHDITRSDTALGC